MPSACQLPKSLCDQLVLQANEKSASRVYMTYVAAVIELSAVQEPGNGLHNPTWGSNLLHSYAATAQVQVTQICSFPAWKALYCLS